MTLRVLAPGLHSLVVDFGRPGYRSLGVAVGGAADRAALAIGNALVGNRPDAAALEICLAGPALQATCELACVLYGAPFELHSDRQRFSAGKTFTLHTDDVLHVQGTSQGMRAYLCVGGGLDVPLVLGSRSALQPLRTGDELRCTPGGIHGRFVCLNLKWNRQPKLLRVVDGPQADWFRQDEFYAQEFSVAPASDRMGQRLLGLPLSMAARELVSEPVSPGAVQITHDGQGIVLGMDGQTIGGYPKIAHVISADLDKLGQLRAGDCVRFERLSIEEAEAIYRHKHAELGAWLTRLRVTLGD
ncbi:MAG TPA: biotin-dependent carboxyltransferase family protein [Gemmataceae bacterium]|nr:biotin-dependent carboxyltransferase family protein [Gemmataceae bacterium]